MDILNKIIHTICMFENEPQKVGLSQFKSRPICSEPEGPSLRSKDVKLSDLMRRAS